MSRMSVRTQLSMLFIVAVFVIVAVFAPWIATHDVGATNLTIRYLGPSAGHWFGTDSTGRDIFSRIVFGARISLEVGIVVVSVSTLIGTSIGAVSGFYGGWIDRFLSGYVFNVFLAFPGLLLAIAEEKSDDLLNELRRNYPRAEVIGRAKARADKIIFIN